MEYKVNDMVIIKKNMSLCSNYFVSRIAKITKTLIIVEHNELRFKKSENRVNDCIGEIINSSISSPCYFLYTCDNELIINEHIDYCMELALHKVYLEVISLIKLLDLDELNSVLTTIRRLGE